MQKSYATLALCLTLIAAAPAQEKPKATLKPSSPFQRKFSLPKTFDLDYPGGTITGLINTLNTILPTRPNILVTPAASILPVPPLKLTGVDLGALFQALPTFMSNNPGSSKVELRVSNSRRGMAGITTLYTYERRVRKTPTIPDHTEVFNVTDLLTGDRFKITDLVTAIETVWAMNSQDKTIKNPQLKFHKETKLLLVKGSNTAVNLVHNVIRQLQLTSRHKQELTKLKNETKQLKAVIADLEKELASLKKTRSHK